MSNPDSFIEEVSEEVRRDRMSRLMRKYGWIGVVAVLLIVGGAAYNEYAKAQRIAAAQAFGDGIYAALESDRAETRQLALQELAAPEVGAPVLDLIRASEAAQAGGEAAAAFQAVIDNPDSPEIYKDLARLRLAMLGPEALVLSERRALLDSLVLGAGPFRLLGLEQRALLEIEAGDTDAAIDTLQEVIRSAGASQGQQQRAAQLIVALGGDVSLLQG